MEGNELEDTLAAEDVDDPKPVVHLCTGICKDSDEGEEDEESYEVVGMPEPQILCLSPDSNLVTLADGTQWSYVTIAQASEEDLVQAEADVNDETVESEAKMEAEESSLPVADSGARLIILDDGRLAYVQPEEVCEVVPLDDECATLITVTNQTNNNGKALKKRAKSHYCMQPGCARSYTSLHHLKVHIRNHTGDRPYACNVDGCRKAFATDYSRKAHLRTHTGEKPYPCPQESCCKSFKTSGDLQKHIRTHTGERPFICPVEGCNRAFTTSNIRKVHIRTHTGERPYICDHPGCERTFASTTNYKNHMRIHSGEKPFICPVENCQKRFTEYSSLYKHQWVHSQEKRHQCPLCHKTYRQISTLTTHKRTVHGLISADDGTELILEQMIGVGDDGSKNFKNITSNLLNLKRGDNSALITIKEGNEGSFLIVSPTSQELDLDGNECHDAELQISE